MKKSIRTVLLVLFAVALILGVTLTASAAEVASGTCGDNLTWVLTDDGTLTISGYGDMYDYMNNHANYPNKKTPWYEYRHNIKKVVLPDGITSIGDGAFESFTALEGIDLPEGIMSIGEYAFYDCSKLLSIDLPEKITAMEQSVFSHCSSLTEVVVPDGVTTLAIWAFAYCNNLAKITLPASLTTIEVFAFSQSSNLTDVYYGGTEEDWQKISIANYNEPLHNANRQAVCKGAEILTDYISNDNGTHTISKACSLCCGNMGTKTGNCSDSDNDGFCDSCNWCFSAASYMLISLSLKNSEGNLLDTIPAGGFYAEAKVKKLQDDEPALVMLVTYTAEGQMLSTAYLQADVPTGSTYSHGSYISNADGKVGEVKAFILSSLGNPISLGESISVK